MPYAYDIVYQLQRLVWRSSYIRAVNFHDIPFESFSSFESQISLFRRYFSDVTLEDLHIFLGTGEWHKDKPGIILSFDDGFRSFYEVVFPILNKYGFTGWFLIPTSFIDEVPHLQVNFAQEHLIDIKQKYQDHRIAMSWEEIKQLDEEHVIVSHTKTHIRLKPGLHTTLLEEEIYGSKERLERKLGHSVDCFGWVGGEISSYDRTAAQIIAESGYRYAFMTKAGPILPRANNYQLHRIF